MNPSALMKLVNAKNKFVDNHPKFTAFLSAMYSRGFEAGTVIEMTHPGEGPVTSNIRVQESDLELLQSLKDLAN